MSSTTPRPISRPKRSPKAMVSASVAVRYVGTDLHGAAEVAQQVRRHQTFLADVARCQLRGETVQVYGGAHRFVRLTGELREESRDHPGQHVAAAAGAERGCAGGVDPCAAVAKRDHGALAFQHQRDAMLLGEGASGGDAVLL